ncbi:isocitrate lyase/PEP mutase family protein [Asanoa siamensis]|uniref:2-methylisocitrate lyase-like PEP mutase family enzyme n=1 Tax=Asanoa siamensis TaxID=926357 RepID=A0ABQ4D269_9ACTN|nr:isocitrate lyase/phosphoenolpyruvate mutase family protein [Asanoa siamensis]GIF77212.1 hypothetical protein Asi02nite_67300 [Asanoa siamensis]
MTHELFRSGRPLVLPNAWDVASAKLIERAGAVAIATTSAGVAWGLGHRDGGAIGRAAALEMVARIVAATSVPVTADVEDGYGDVAGTVKGVVDAGAVGVNIEDGIHAEPDRIATARRTAGTDLFLNARVDTYLLGIGAPERRLDETLDRAAAYVEAGADGIFVPGVTDADTIAALAKALPVPLNVMAGPGSPAVADLVALGVARVSVGPAITLAAYAATRRAARELLTTGTYGALDGDTPSVADIEMLMGQ